jgi:hypothetical protein
MTRSISLLIWALLGAPTRSDFQCSAGFFTLSAVSMRLSQNKLEPVDVIDTYRVDAIAAWFHRANGLAISAAYPKPCLECSTLDLPFSRMRGTVSKTLAKLNSQEQSLDNI